MRTLVVISIMQKMIFVVAAYHQGNKGNDDGDDTDVLDTYRSTTSSVSSFSRLVKSFSDSSFSITM